MNSFDPWLSQIPLGVLGMGAALPGPPLTTQVLVERMVERFGFSRSREALSIAQRMLISSRHICRPFAARHELPTNGQSNPELAARAVRIALDEAGLRVTDIGYLIGHTTTPASSLPANIAAVADLIGYGGPHVELRQACTGFANALMIAHGLVACGGKPVAIVGSETGSIFFDPAELDSDPDQIVNMIQMGDGAGAIILGAAGAGRGTINAAWYGAIGLDRAPGIARRQGAMRFEHDFGAIRQHGHLLFDAGLRAAASQGFGPENSDRIVPHQVSGRIGELMTARYGLAPGQPFVNADHCGNTGSAAIWLALAELRRESLAAGQRVLVLGAEASKYMYGGFHYAHA